jgi:hypothetical protein
VGWLGAINFWLCPAGWEELRAGQDPSGPSYLSHSTGLKSLLRRFRAASPPRPGPRVTAAWEEGGGFGTRVGLARDPLGYVKFAVITGMFIV